MLENTFGVLLNGKICIFSFKPHLDVKNSINFLESEFLRGISDNYTLALTTYALSFLGSPKAAEALDILIQRADLEGICIAHGHEQWGSEDPGGGVSRG